MITLLVAKTASRLVEGRLDIVSARKINNKVYYISGSLWIKQESHLFNEEGEHYKNYYNFYNINHAYQIRKYGYMKTNTED